MRNNLYEQILLLKRLISLIKRKATGPRELLCRRINRSKATTHRLIDTLKKLGYPVKYSHDQETYFFDGDEESNSFI